MSNMSVEPDSNKVRLSPHYIPSSRMRPDRVHILSNSTIISNMNASAQNEDENLLKSKRDIIIPVNSQTTGPNLSDESQNSMQSKKLRDLMSSKIIEIAEIGLIIIYTLIVLTNIILDDGSFDGQMDDALTALKYVEVSILVVFTVEIALKIWGFGLKGYFKDCWYILDAIIISATFALVIVDITLSENRFSGLSRIRGLFRLFRIFMLMRKANQFSRITRSRIKTIGVDFKSPVEKIVELLESLKQCINDKTLSQEIDWAIEVISTNKLYEPLIESTDEKNKSDANLWLTFGKFIPKFMNRNDPKVSIRSMRKMTLLTPSLVRKDSPALVTPIPQEAYDMLEKDANNFNFDVFAFRNAAKDNELVYLSCYLFHKHNLFDFLNINQSTFTKFIKQIQIGYLPNVYHNSTHATDVLQTTNYFMTTGGFLEQSTLSHIEVGAMYIAAAIHDYEHPGTNNVFQINTKSVYAITYNDRAVLENHHLAASFELLKDEALNIFANFSKSDYRVIRERMIAMVLATDMSNHFTDIGKLKGRLAADYDIKNKDKNFTMELLIHAADISNPTKPWNICHEWSLKVMKEFFDQGDMERGLDLPITHLCDKYTVNIAKSQVGFIDFVVAPFYSLMKEILPKIDISNLEINKNKWKELIDHHEQEMSNLLSIDII